MNSRRLLSIVTVVILLAPGGTVRATDGKCLGTFIGASLTSRLLDLSIILNAAKLLDGAESPKLREFLEWQLLSAAADARRYVDQRPEVDAASMRNTAPNWLNVVEKARKYVKSHKLDQTPPPEAEGDARMPLANLDRVKEWLLEQQRGRGE
jgi:hypothetical protein